MDIARHGSASLVLFSVYGSPILIHKSKFFKPLRGQASQVLAHCAKGGTVSFGPPRPQPKAGPGYGRCFIIPQ